jgi:hypothetical protein
LSTPTGWRFFARFRAACIHVIQKIAEASELAFTESDFRPKNSDKESQEQRFLVH